MWGRSCQHARSSKTCLFKKETMSVKSLGIVRSVQAPQKLEVIKITNVLEPKHSSVRIVNHQVPWHTAPSFATETLPLLALHLIILMGGGVVTMAVAGDGEGDVEADVVVPSVEEATTISVAKATILQVKWYPMVKWCLMGNLRTFLSKKIFSLECHIGILTNRGKDPFLNTFNVQEGLLLSNIILCKMQIQEDYFKYFTLFNLLWSVIFIHPRNQF